MVKLKSMDLKKKINLNMVPIAVITVALTIVVSRDLSNNGKELQEALVFKSNVEHLLPTSLIQDDATKAMLLDPDRLGYYSERKIEAYDLNLENLTKLQENTSDEQLKQRITELLKIDQDYLRPLDTKILETLFMDQQEAIKIYFEEFLPWQEKYNDLLGEIGKLGEKRVGAAREDFAKRNRNTIILFASLLVGGALLVGVALRFTAHIISKNLVSSMGILQEESQNFHDLATEIQKTGANLREYSTSNQSDAKEAISLGSTLEDGSRELKELSRVIHRASESLENFANLGRSRLQDLGNSNQQLSNDFSKLTQLSSAVGDISKKIAMIDQIVFKTNLLSVNASIEAAKAGEHGKGFSVVAEEVGTLASLSGEISEAIAGRLEDVSTSCTTLISTARSSLETEKKAITELNKVFADLFQQSTEMVQIVHRVNGQIEQQTDQQSQMSQKISDIIRRFDTMNEMINNYYDVTRQVENSERGIKNVGTILHKQVFGQEEAPTPSPGDEQAA
ncbi:methyl-accepting chemotaxis protein [Pseudobacteriovorax antillogorgiicola]|uniref:Methyl-accepting chemotaxis protein (MCP) signalling domain-containing protein n=1 Tax=Pseudobacteriovorax antillogorgiicola TaxID=1513793 RepID=A0A1Y6CU51_9BACT|nr:methyl-accepting chemotaxis protein [Pseudobacteriovorax antillogorgiicola]TCS44602.1 methyl-accepting chemotaxis protein (MCP) signaling protein [Pseudobacteriovorax antillogorgiicola]SMF78181.1 Methyl-accepting chemotaxis protein (MCP) signalling domain-containing protein [Pseudobacteriovorax antillogorgiicola]